MTERKARVVTHFCHGCQNRIRNKRDRFSCPKCGKEMAKLPEE
jgi:predicted RNA-binding Zn-ribbon protein involved in translation (DUF1610 family)